MLFILLACGKPVPPEAAPPAHDPVGDWGGDIALPGGNSLPFVIHITPDDSGGFTGTADSPDQGAFGLPISSVSTDGDSLTVEIAAVKGTFTGTYTDTDTLAGQWKQGIAKLPLTLARGEVAAPPARPQMPEAPFPYRTEDLQVTLEAHTLAGTLTIPEGDGPFPGVVLITGSGPQDRDESLMGHKPFLVLADHLTRSGIAVYRYDDRGVGESTGDFEGATTVDFGADATAALAALRARPEVSAAGLVGHSEGGMIAPIIAAEAAPDFMVLLAPPAVPIGELMLAQVEAVSRSAGTPEETIAQLLPLQEQVYDLATAGDTPENRAALAALIPTMPGAEELDAEAIGIQIDAIYAPWMSWFLRYDPSENLTALDVPVYALWGSRDVQVLSEQNAPAFTTLTAGNPAAKGQVFEGLNHLFQPAVTGAVSEYAKIETTIDPAVLSAVSDWIRSVNEFE